MLRAWPQGIVEWVDKKTSEGITAVTRPGELQYIVEEENMFVVGYFSNLDSEEYKVVVLDYDINLHHFLLVESTLLKQVARHPALKMTCLQILNVFTGEQFQGSL